MAAATTHIYIALNVNSTQYHVRATRMETDRSLHQSQCLLRLSRIKRSSHAMLICVRISGNSNTGLRPRRHHQTGHLLAAGGIYKRRSHLEENEEFERGEVVAMSW